MPAVLLADSEEVARLTFAQLVDSIRADSDVTQTMKSHNGKEVEVRGFIIPAGPPDRWGKTKRSTYLQRKK